MWCRKTLLTVFCVACAPSAWAVTDTVLLLHTNDIHDHVRSDYDGAGGLPWAAGYIRKVKSERADTLVVDAGDVMEKGDMVADATKSTLLYEAMGRIGYDAATPGNHDFSFGFDHLLSCAALAPKMRMLAVNAPGNRLAASALIDVDGVKVGLIGVTALGEFQEEFGLKKTAELVRAEAEKLEPDAHLIVVVAHAGSKDCRAMSQAAPSVDVFVSGHTHEILEEPVRVEETGALIVQTGDYAERVGRLELTVDLETERLVAVQGELVAMKHGTVPCDGELQARIAAEERKHCPEAIEPVGILTEPMGRLALASAAAEAIRSQAGADIAFCHPGQVIRSLLPVGPFDVNAVYRTGGNRGKELVALSLTGAQINAYIESLAKTDWGGTVGAGYEPSKDASSSPATNLSPDKTYRVVLPRIEFDSRLKRAFERFHIPGTDALKPEPIPLTYTQAFTQWWRAKHPAAKS